MERKEIIEYLRDIENKSKFRYQWIEHLVVIFNKETQRALVFCELGGNCDEPGCTNQEYFMATVIKYSTENGKLEPIERLDGCNQWIYFNQTQTEYNFEQKPGDKGGFIHKRKQIMVKGETVRYESLHEPWTI